LGPRAVDELVEIDVHQARLARVRAAQCTPESELALDAERERLDLLEPAQG
jgi:hypothetical protein